MKRLIQIGMLLLISASMQMAVQAQTPSPAPTPTLTATPTPTATPTATPTPTTTPTAAPAQQMTSDQIIAAIAALAAKKPESTVPGTPCKAWAAPNPFLLYLIPLMVLIGIFMTIFMLRGALPSGWSIADAMSEEVQLPIIETTTDAAGVKTTAPRYDKTTGNPLLAPQMRASTSRLIAFMGLVAILFLFIGFGVFSLFSFGSTGCMPDSMERVVQFLLAGLTLFAPYAVNKVSAMFQGFSGTPPK